MVSLECGQGKKGRFAKGSRHKYGRKKQLKTNGTEFCGTARAEFQNSQQAVKHPPVLYTFLLHHPPFIAAKKDEYNKALPKEPLSTSKHNAQDRILAEKVHPVLIGIRRHLYICKLM